MAEGIAQAEDAWATGELRCEMVGMTRAEVVSAGHADAEAEDFHRGSPAEDDSAP